MVKQFIIEGSAVHDIPSFYEELNGVFVSGEEWRLGKSLDAFNDLLHGGFGAMAGAVRHLTVSASGGSWRCWNGANGGRILIC